MLYRGMRTILILGMLLTFSTDTVLSQEIRLIDYTSSPDYSMNIDKVGKCVLKKALEGDILTLELFSTNTQYSVKPKFEFTYGKGILRIETKLPMTQLKDTVYYDKVQKKKITMHAVRMDYSINVDVLGPKAKREVFRFKGFKECPTSVYLNDELYPNYPERDIEYRTYKGQIINRINSNGYKEGLWITFYDTGEVYERKQYNNGAFQGGKTYDKNGKDLHYVTESEGGITSFQSDSLMTK